jgi:hypothetical protein
LVLGLVGLIDYCGSTYIVERIAASMYLWSVSLVYQLSGQFLIFLVDQKKFWYTKTKFGIPKKDFGIPKRNLVDQKKNLDDQKKDLVYQKKIWSTKKMRN